MASVDAHLRAAPPFWVPLLAGLPLGVCLLVMALPIMGHGAATASRALYLLAFVLWIVPLTALQRELWRRGAAGWAMAFVLLAATYAMALATRALYMGMQLAMSGELATDLDWSLVFRGLEGPWLTLIAYCAIHAVVAFYVELQHEQARHLQAQALARDAELRALRYQLQPHFLFNTLNAISALVVEGRSREARQMLARLGDFLRATLDGAHGHEVSLADELALTEAYLEIEKARLGERLQLKWQIGPDLLRMRVPYLLLQPLVENAIRHGIAPRSSPGRLAIRVTGEAGELRVEVSNDLAASEGEYLSETSTRDAESRSGAVGLRNIGERLAKLYPGAHAMHAGVQANGCYRVVLQLPLRTDGGVAT
jgi:two-component system, LytTR family, sensor histidine kinase AlgZ